MVKKTVLFVLAILLLSGCFASNDDVDALKKQVNSLQNELESVKNNLGAYQSLGLDPKIKIELSNIKFLPASRYGTPEVTADIKVLQQNDQFPLDKYTIQIQFSVRDSMGNELSDNFQALSIENKKYQANISLMLYGIKKKDFSGCQLIPESLSWHPNIRFKIKY